MVPWAASRIVGLPGSGAWSSAANGASRSPCSGVEDRARSVASPSSRSASSNQVIGAIGNLHAAADLTDPGAGIGRFGNPVRLLQARPHILQQTRHLLRLRTRPLTSGLST